ncbi:MAG: aldehyde ferredoxin oxidoreductase family protein [Candidatus Helarchaeota archaeon]
MKGYTGNILKINLSENKIEKDTITNQFCEEYIGGYGFGAKILWDELKPGIDPLMPENILVFATGCAGGTILPSSSNCCVFAKSPLTGLFGMEVIHGSIGQQMKRAGYDIIEIKGKAPDPVFLFINDDNIEIHSAKDLWGKKDTEQTEKYVKNLYKDDKIAVISIGQACENLSPIGCLKKNNNRPAGRNGLGAVMGSKNLKCIAFSGTKSIEVADHKNFMEKAYDLVKTASGPIMSKYKNIGTPANVSVLNKIGALPTNNFIHGTFNKSEEISGETILKNWVTKNIACSNCPVACNHISYISKGKYKGIFTPLDYESIFALGSCCGISDIPSIIKAVALCDNYGLDPISVGVSIAFAMECYEKGIINDNDTGGIQLKFGKTEALIQMIEDIAFGKTEVGKILAKGSKFAAETWGNGSKEFAMNIKGLELPGYSLRTLQSTALALSVSLTGTNYLQNGSYILDPNNGIERMKIGQNDVKSIISSENLYAVMDSLIICKFTGNCYSGVNELAEIYQLITGILMDGEKMLKIGERIHNLVKCFNVREGAVRSYDYPPERTFKEKLNNEPNRGAIIDRKEYDKMLDKYYELRGWSKEGIPSKEKLKDLGLEFCIDKMGGK